MRRLCAWALGTFFLIAGPGICAQRSKPPQPPAAPTEPSLDDELSDFKQAVLLQASPRQALQFGQFAESTVKARQRARAVADRTMTDIVHGADPLIDLLDDVQWDGAHFLASFTQNQKSGLKPLTRKLAKAKKDVDKHTKALQAGRAAGNETQIVAAASKLEEALAKFEVQQHAIGREMGIPNESAQQ